MGSPSWVSLSRNEFERVVFLSAVMIAGSVLLHSLYNNVQALEIVRLLTKR